MEWYFLLATGSAFICLVACTKHTVRLISLGKPLDYSSELGNTSRAIRYSFTGAMSPRKKESAFLHLPTYLAGLLFHVGTFLSLALFILIITGIQLPELVISGGAALLFITGICGLGILVKRISKKNLRTLSNPDDYVSNLLVSGVQLLTAGFLLAPSLGIAYSIMISLFFLYLPIGKLRHTIYFFAARYHLGFFYGRRGTWPPKQT